MLRAYKVRIGADTIDVLGFTCADAIVTAINARFNGEDAIPTEGLSISARPA